MIATGLRQILEDGDFVVTSAVAGSHIAGQVVVVVVRSSQGMQEVRETRRANPDIPVVALTDYHDADLAVDIVGAGATSVIPWGCESDALVAAVRMARSGISAVETATLQWVVHNGRGGVGITDAERSWLGHLERGITVAQLAPLAGYSERSLYRQLHDLYQRLGATDRVGAIAEAKRRSLL